MATAQALKGSGAENDGYKVAWAGSGCEFPMLAPYLLDERENPIF
jgi:hypothetical protein